MAQQQLDQVRASAALPYMSQQRNFAMDALAVCNGDLQTLQQKLKEAEDKLKTKEPEKKPEP
jgi:hypothetical protein